MFQVFVDFWANSWKNYKCYVLWIVFVDQIAPQSSCFYRPVTVTAISNKIRLSELELEMGADSRKIGSDRAIPGQRGSEVRMPHHHFPKLHCSNNDVNDVILRNIYGQGTNPCLFPGMFIASNFSTFQFLKRGIFFTGRKLAVIAIYWTLKRLYSSNVMFLLCFYHEMQFSNWGDI